VSIHHSLSGFVLGFSAGIAPGPLLTLVIAQSMTYGMAEGVKVAVAPLVTDLPIIVAALLLGSRLVENPLPLGLLSLAGAAYLCYLAWESLKIQPVPQNRDSRAPRSVRRGVLTNFLNPHVYLFWTTVGTPLLYKAWKANPAGSALWLAGFYIMLVGTKVTLAVLVGRWNRLLQGRSYIWLNRIMGAALLFFAGVLVRDGWVMVSV
jgi:threonine/homoserine/homoserine lactone efflux protein